MHPRQMLPRKPPVEFTAERKAEFLRLFRSDPDCGGLLYLTAERVGVAPRTVQEHRKADPEFNAQYEAAHEAWIDENLVLPALHRGRNGVEEPIIGGKFRDEVVATKRVYSDHLLSLALRARRPEYRDGNAAAASSGGSSGGVLIVPSAPSTLDDWQKQFGELATGKHGRPEGET